MKKYVVIAGVNGAGKSTLYQTCEALKNISRVNTDEILREFGDYISLRNSVGWSNFSEEQMKKIYWKQYI